MEKASVTRKDEPFFFYASLNIPSKHFQIEKLSTISVTNSADQKRFAPQINLGISFPILLSIFYCLLTDA